MSIKNESKLPPVQQYDQWIEQLRQIQHGLHRPQRVDEHWPYPLAATADIEKAIEAAIDALKVRLSEHLLNEHFVGSGTSAL